MILTPRENFIKALKREKITGHVPHFELVFFLTMEVLGKVHPSHRYYAQWNQMSRTEQKLQMLDMAQSYIDIAEKYDHSAIFVHQNPDTPEQFREILETIRELSGDKYFLMVHGDPTLSVPDGDNMMEFSIDMYENPDKVHEKVKRNMEQAIKSCDFISQYKGLLDGYGLCADYAFNTNPFYSLEMFEEFVVPYLTDIITYYHANDKYVIKHTDGNIAPIMEAMIGCGPDALHSLDPQGGIDLKEVKEKYGNQICLIGNVNCGLLQTGTLEEAAADVRRSLQDGMPGYGYIFSTSNCVYTGLPLERYELMHKIWKEEGIYL